MDTFTEMVSKNAFYCAGQLHHFINYTFNHTILFFLSYFCIGCEAKVCVIIGSVYRNATFSLNLTLTNRYQLSIASLTSQWRIKVLPKCSVTQHRCLHTVESMELVPLTDGINVIWFQSADRPAQITLCSK
jgi:hypothetical protein